MDLVRGIPGGPPLIPYDEGYISCIFFQNAQRVLQYSRMLDFPVVVVGGSGVDSGSVLIRSVEHIMPDYSLYDIDFSLGFTSRGCIRKCPWCIVPEKEGAIRDNAPVSEFHHPDHKKVVLLDNNFQASPKWRENLQYIIDKGLKVNINQGLDIRIVDEEFASMLAQAKTYGWTFKTRGLHFGFDTMRVEKAVRCGVEILNNAGIPSHHLMFYVLAGYNTTLEEDMHRVDVIRELGAKPYIMKYNQNSDPELKRLARWINRKYYEFLPFENFMVKEAA